MEYVVPALIGLVAGWVAHLVLGGAGGLVRNLIVGLLGAYVGKLLLPKIGVAIDVGHATGNALIEASIGACVVLLIVQLLGSK